MHSLCFFFHGLFYFELYKNRRNQLFTPGYLMDPFEGQYFIVQHNLMLTLIFSKSRGEVVVLVDFGLKTGKTRITKGISSPQVI